MSSKRRWVGAGALVLAVAGYALQFRGDGKVDSSHEVSVGGATIQVDFAQGPLDLGIGPVVERIKGAAHAVAMYYGRFPVARARVLIVPVRDRHGVFRGTTWGGVGGFAGFTRISLGQQTTEKELADDWMITHELSHMAFPNLSDEHHWMEEGLATYVEPIARVQAGELSAKAAWRDMMDGMPKGEPQSGDEGLDRTHTWGRTYWGGALFCLAADVEIRKETKNRKGLQDALRAIVEAGGTIDQDWPIERAFEIGDKATGTRVLTQMYAKWSDAPVRVDLDALWKELGVRRVGEGVELDATAPLAAVRDGIMRGSRL
ncbi:gluzincin family metallopeptidase [Edaphobacter flagellatus]|uniref:hypothetical protein n=1 Tax=Edaphobacter flagellatus TaxID=1933044 RepID=UPI0021B445E1|nr:hypothetical protein [Edaphobacter flagellatus]